MTDDNSPDLFIIPDNPYDISDSMQLEDVSIDFSEKENPPMTCMEVELVDYVEDSENSKCKCKCTKIISIIANNKLLTISTSITLLFIIITSAVAGAINSKNRMHIVTRTLEIVNMRGCFFIWALHCVGLLILPWLFHYLFPEISNPIIIFLPPFMMFLNMLGGFISIKGSCYPLIIEVLITMYLLFSLPFKRIYFWGTHDFWIGEITLMTLTFIYISSALGASTLSYILFARYVRINKYLIYYPSNPYYAIEYINSSGNVNGSFLACYSLFTFFSVGIGFLMSFRNSILMALPFLILAICTVIETHGIGILLFCQLLFHIIYMIALYKSKTKKAIAGCCNCCYYSCNATLTTIMIGDIIGFALVVFPIFGILLDGYRAKWNWGYFIGGSLFIMVGVIAHFTLVFDSDSIFSIIISPLFLTAGVYMFGFGFKGYFPFIRAFTYEITYLSWSFILCFWAWCNGFSPVLFKTYNTLISVSVLIIVDVYEGFGWIELLFTLIQIFFDTSMIMLMQRYQTKYIAWAVFSVAGIAVMGFISGVVIVVLAIICLLILACLCGGGRSPEDQARDYINDHNLKPGDEFECAGERWIVVSN